MDYQSDLKHDPKMHEIKKGFYGVLTLFFLVFTLLLIYSMFWGPLKHLAESLMPSRVVTVTADAKATLVPDIAQFSFSVVTEGTDSQVVADQNNKIMNQAIDFVKSNGVALQDIKTIQYNLSPRYNYDRNTGKSYIYGYELDQMVSVKIRDFSKIGKLLGGLPSYGVNDVSSISFQVDDPEKYLVSARDQAFDKAQSKANEMATKLGVRLGDIINFVESSSGPGPLPYETIGKFGLGGVAPSVAPAIQPGSQETTVTVSVTYEIR